MTTKITFSEAFSDKDILNFHLGLFVVLAFLEALRTTLQGNDFYLTWIIVIAPFGHYLIASLIYYFHGKAETGENENLDKQLFHYTLKRFAGFLETIFFAFLIVFHQLNFLIGWVVVKTIGSHWIDDKNNKKKNKTLMEGAAVAIFRIGNILLVLLSCVIAFFLSKSHFIKLLDPFVNLIK